MNKERGGWIFLAMGLLCPLLFLFGSGVLNSGGAYDLVVVYIFAWLAGLLFLSRAVYRSTRRHCKRRAPPASFGRGVTGALFGLLVMGLWFWLLPRLMHSQAGRLFFMVVVGLGLSLFIPTGLAFLAERKATRE